MGVKWVLFRKDFFLLPDNKRVFPASYRKLEMMLNNMPRKKSITRK
jgi:hypothetical protein